MLHCCHRRYWYHRWETVYFDCINNFMSEIQVYFGYVNRFEYRVYIYGNFFREIFGATYATQYHIQYIYHFDYDYRLRQFTDKPELMRREARRAGGVDRAHRECEL